MRARPPCKLRGDLIIKPRSYAGEVKYVVKDPVQLTYYNVNELCHQLLMLCDGKRDVATLTELGREFLADLDEATMLDFLENFRKQRFFDDAWERRILLIERQRTSRSRAFKEATANLLDIKLPAWDPDRFLDRIDRPLSFLFTRKAVGAYVLLFLAASALSIAHRSEFKLHFTDIYMIQGKALLGILTLWFILLFTVVLHELGHGLGFSTLVDLSTGALSGGLADMYMRFIRDTSTNKLWTQMTNAERAASAINTANVVWDGPAVRGHSPNFLGPRPILRVNTPPAIAGTYAMGTASFGAAVTLGGLTGDVVLADDGALPNSDACSALVNGAQVSGKICLIDRGTCTFASKAKQAQNAGAIGVIIANNVAGPTPPGMGGTDPTVVIPVVSVTQATGTSIKAQLVNGVNVTMTLDPAQYAGADAQKRVFLYAPNPLQSGSSISHWDVSASPNLLMEPAITGDLTSSVDLARYLFEDIGWFGPTTGVADLSPRTTRLLDNVPNPFNPSTTIHFELAQDGAVSLDVYDLAGRRIKNLVQADLRRGFHPATWDGTDARGTRVASGVYLYRLETPDHAESRRMVLLK